MTAPDLVEVVAGVIREHVLDWQFDGNRGRLECDCGAEVIAGDGAAHQARAVLAALRAVEAVHEPILALDYGVRDAPLKRQVCTGCGQDDGNWQIWPCPTIRAITGALA